MMSRPVLLDIPENEQPNQATQNTAPKNVCTPVQEDCQTQALDQIPQAVTHQPESSPEGPLPASQGHLHSYQQPCAGPKQPEPEPERHEQYKQQYVCGQTVHQLSNDSFRSCISSANVHARGAATSVHFTSNAYVVDPPPSAADSPNEAVLPSPSSSPGSELSIQTTSASPQLQCPTPPPRYRTQQRETHTSFDANLSKKFRDRVEYSAREGSQSSSRKRPIFFAVCGSSETTNRFRSGPLAHKVSQSEIEASSKTFVTNESTEIFKRETADSCGGKSPGPFVKKQSETAASGEPTHSVQERPVSSETRATCCQDERSQFSLSAGAFFPEGLKERTSSQICSTFTPPDQTIRCESNQTRLSPSRGQRESSVSTSECCSPERRSKRCEDTSSQFTFATKSSGATVRETTDSSLETQRATSATTEKGKKICNRNSRTRRQSCKSRDDASEFEQETRSPSHHKEQRHPLSAWQSDSHTSTDPPTTSSATTPTTLQPPSPIPESTLLHSSGHTRKGTSNRTVGSSRRSRSRGTKAGNERVSRRLTTVSTPFPTSAPIPHDSNFMQMASSAVDQHTPHGQAAVHIKEETVDDDYPHVGDAGKSVHCAVFNTPRPDQGPQSALWQKQDHSAEGVLQTPGIGRQWSILYETPLAKPFCRSSSFETCSNKYTKEEIDTDTKNKIDEDCKEDIDKDTKDNIYEDTKKRINKEKIQDTNNFDQSRSEHSSENHLYGVGLKAVKNEFTIGEDMKVEESFELPEKFASDSVNSDCPSRAVRTARRDDWITSTCLQSGGRRKQKTPRQFRKQSVLQSECLSKNESVQTDGDGNEIIAQGVAVTDYLCHGKKICHTHYHPSSSLLNPHDSLQVPIDQKTSTLSKADEQHKDSKCLTHAEIGEAATFPGQISKDENHLNSSGFQMVGYCVHTSNTYSNFSGDGNVHSNPDTLDFSPTSNCSRTSEQRPLDYRSQTTMLNTEALPPKRNKPPDRVKATKNGRHSSTQTVTKGSTVMPVQATPLPLIRLPYIPVPVHYPAVPPVLPALSKYQVHPSKSVPSGTSVPSPTSHKSAQYPSYVPIVPKMPAMISGVPTTLPVLGTSQMMGNLTKAEAPSAGYQTVQCTYSTTTNMIPVLNVQQKQSGEANGTVMQRIMPQLGIIRNQMLSPCLGNIPVLIFLPNTSQNLPASQIHTDTIKPTGLKSTTAKANVEEKCPEMTKVTDDDKVTVPDSIDAHIEVGNPGDQEDANDPHQASRSTDVQFSNEISGTITKASRCTEAESIKEESRAMTTEGIENTSAPVLTSSKDAACKSAEISTPSFQNEREGVNVLKSDSKKTARNTDATGDTVTPPYFPFHYDACKRAEEIVFSTSSTPPPQRDVSGTCRETSSVTSTEPPGQDKNSQASAKTSEETSTSVRFSKSGRKRIASTRYDFHTDIELSECSDKGDITPITSDDEWTPEKDNEGQSTHSSEDEESQRKLRKRDSFADLFHPSNKRKARRLVKTGQNITRNQQKREIPPCSASPTVRQPQEQTLVNMAKPHTLDREKTCHDQQTPVGNSLEKKDKDRENAPPEEKSKQRKPNGVSKPSLPAVLQAPAPKKRRKTPYTKEELTCRLCSKTFINIYRLKRHEFSHGDERPYVCDDCGKAFKQSGHRNEHRLTHGDNKRSFLCNECGVVITSRSSFRYHLLSHKQLLSGSVNTARCEITTRGEDTGALTSAAGSEEQHGHSRQLDQSSDMLNTLRSREMDSPVAAAYDCPHCILRFATAQSLNCHLESHQEVELRCHVQPFTCGECGRCFTYRHNLEKHRECHVKPEKRADSYQRQVQAAIAAGKPHFVCDTCGKVYLRKETLTKHIKTHLGLKPFQCMECLKSFTQKIHLTVHSRLHTGSRPFQCRTCRCCFLDSTALARHVMRDVCKSDGFSFNVGKRGRKPFHVAAVEKVKAIVKSNREQRQRKGPATLKCGLCSWTGKYEGFLRRHIQRRHPTQVQKALQDSIPPSSAVNRNNATTSSTVLETPSQEEENTASTDHSLPTQSLGENCTAETGGTESGPRNLSQSTGRLNSATKKAGTESCQSGDEPPTSDSGLSDFVQKTTTQKQGCTKG